MPLILYRLSIFYLINWTGKTSAMYWMQAPSVLIISPAKEVTQHEAFPPVINLSPFFTAMSHAYPLANLSTLDP